MLSRLWTHSNLPNHHRFVFAASSTRLNVVLYNNILSKAISKTLLNKMPVEPVAARVLKQQRLEKEQKNVQINLIPSMVTLGVLGNGGLGSPSGIFINTDYQSYLFNCGESTQRLSQEHGWRLAKCNNVFITNYSWKNLSGLCGFGLTLQSIGVPRINLHGSSKLLEFFDDTSLFGVTADLELIQYPSQVYEDGCMTVEYLPLERTMDSEHSPSQIKRIKMEQKSPDVFCFLCTLKDKPGKLVLQKCIDLKIPRGPLLAQLKAGKNITLEDGRVITQKDVCEEPVKGVRILILDCPSIDYSESLFLNPKINMATLDDEHPVTCIVHFTPLEVLNTMEYQNWLRIFPKDSTHIFINEHNSPFAFEAAHLLQQKLSTLDPELFPMLKVEDKTVPLDFKVNTKLNLIQPSTNYEYCVRPKGKKLLSKDPLSLNVNLAKEEMDKIPGIQQAIDTYCSKIKEINDQSDQYPQLIPFGTASAIAGKLRTVTCLLININESSSMIFDCGEGSFGQFVRFYGPERLKQIMINLKSIFISHFHADHHIGLTTFLKYRKNLQKELSLPPINLYCPDVVFKFLTKLNQTEPILDTVTYVDNPRVGFKTISTDLTEKSDLAEITICRVKHCRQSCGIAIKTKPNGSGNSYKIVFSGDTLPTNLLVDIGKDADLLVHEATFDDLHEYDALAKHHSTSTQAIDIGKCMNARYTLLTHFSQRYSKLPFINDAFNSNVGIAFDNMCLKLTDLGKLSYFVDFIKVFYAEEYQELVRRNQIKTVQQQLLKKIIKKKIENDK